MQYYFSDNLKELSEQLVKDIREKEKSVFQTSYIITQTAGMDTWLKQELTKQLGIFCNFKFMGLKQYLEVVIELLLGKRESYSQHNIMAWNLFSILGRNAPEVESLKNFFEEDQVKRMDLALKIADVFDQYQAFRPEMINAWNKGELYYKDKCNSFELWQLYLWQEMRKNYEFADLPSVVEQVKTLIQNLDEVQKQNVLKKMPRVYFFGFSTFTTLHISLLNGFSKIIPTHIYLNNYAPDIYWEEDKSEEVLRRFSYKDKDLKPIKGNSLLLNWGLLMRNALIQFSKADADDFFNYATIVSKPKADFLPQTLLEAVKDTVWNNKIFKSEYEEECSNMVITANWDSFLTDKTIHISSHFSIKREVENLFNYLVDLFTQSNEYKERIKMTDVLVVVNDMDAYAPYIKTIFDQEVPTESLTKDGGRGIFSFKNNYTIADEKLKDDQSVMATLLSLIELDENHITAESVLNILSKQMIRQTFQLQEDDLSFLKKAMLSAAACFGWDNSKDDDTYLVSINMGLRRMLMGGLVADEELLEYDGYEVVPIDLYDNYSDLEKVLHFSYFLEKLQEYMNFRKVSHPLKAWYNYVEELLNTFIADYGNDQKELYWWIMNEIHEVDKMEKIIQEQEVSFQAFRHQLLERFKNEQDQSNFLSRGLTFCSPIPFRTIPFKVICVLGLNDADFPRKNKNYDFDLMNLYPQVGDRNLNANDKQLFLDTLMNAENYLYLSYIGKDIKDASERPPSVLVDKLLDYISRACQQDVEAVKERVVAHHPLWSFDSRYNKGKQIGNTYLIQQKSLPELMSVTVDEENRKDEVSIKELSKFLENAVAYYYENVLGVYLDNKDDALQETEKFELNHLEKWSIKDRLVKAQINGEVIHFDKDYKKGAMPLLNLFRLCEQQANKDIESLTTTIKEAAGLQKVKIEGIHIDGVKISGYIEYLNQNEDTIYSIIVSDNSLKYQIRSFLNFLLAHKSKSTKKLIYHPKNLVIKKTLLLNDKISSEEIDNYLHRIISLWKVGKENLISFSSKLTVEGTELPLNDNVLYDKVENNQFNNKAIKNESLITAFELETLVYNEWVKKMIILLNDIKSYFK